MKNSKYIRNSIIWNQLISICEEQANVLLKVAFGALVREAGDISAGIFNNKGKMLAQAVTGTPGHVNTMAEAVPKFLKIFPSCKVKKLISSPFKNSSMRIFLALPNFPLKISSIA